MLMTPALGQEIVGMERRMWVGVRMEGVNIRRHHSMIEVISPPR